MAPRCRPASALHCEAAVPEHSLSRACSILCCAATGGSRSEPGAQTLPRAPSPPENLRTPSAVITGWSQACRRTVGSTSTGNVTEEVALDTGSQAASPALGRGKRRRLDEVCLELRPADARNVIQSWIVQGKVQVDGRVVTKAGTPVQPGAAVHINAVVPKFVCRCRHNIAMVCL